MSSFVEAEESIEEYIVETNRLIGELISARWDAEARAEAAKERISTSKLRRLRRVTRNL